MVKTKLMIKNLINLLFSKFEWSLSFENSYQINYDNYFSQKSCKLFMINEYNIKS